MKKQRLTVLGSTGSIGTSTLDVVRRHPDQFEVFALSAATQVDALLAQGYQLQSPPPDATVAFFRSEVSRMARLVKQSGLKLD